MKYKKLTIEIPDGYEDEIMRTLTMKIESIVSRTTLKPTEIQRKAFDDTFNEAKQRLNPKLNKDIIK